MLFSLLSADIPINLISLFKAPNNYIRMEEVWQWRFSYGSSILKTNKHGPRWQNVWWLIYIWSGEKAAWKHRKSPHPNHGQPESPWADHKNVRTALLDHSSGQSSMATKDPWEACKQNPRASPLSQPVIPRNRYSKAYCPDSGSRTQLAWLVKEQHPVGWNRLLSVGTEEMEKWHFLLLLHPPG